MLTRRDFFYLSSAALTLRPLAAGSPEFWDKKPPAEWSSVEIDRLLTKSPWAKDAVLQYTEQPLSGGNYPNDPNGYPGGGYPNGGGYPGGQRGGLSIPGIGIPGIGGIGLPRRGGRGTGQPRNGQGTAFQGTVRWESAQPIRDALKSPLPDAFDGHYVIAVTGVPLLDNRSSGSHGEDDDTRASDESLDNLKELTSLQVKGKDYVQAGVVKRQVGTGNTFLFGFSRDMLSIHKNDGEIAFATKLAHVTVTARFSPKEMLYHGDLAV
jgi:hypothetical protein